MEKLSIDEIIEHCKRKVTRYEQLNGIKTLESASISNNFVKEYWEHRQVGIWLQELKEYKQLEEQGLLLRLPCKVGDTVYEIFMECPKDFKKEYCTDREGSCEKCQHRVPVIMSSTFCFQHLQKFGKTVFLTQAEAEKEKEIRYGKESDIH